MDDETIGCGAFLASLPRKDDIHFYFCGDGLGSFSSAFVEQYGMGKLKELRKQEARNALAALGIPSGHVYFADRPEWTFQAQREEINLSLTEWLNRTQPSVLLTTFRMDCHPDHLALSRITRAWAEGHPAVKLLEFFVYYQLRMLPGGDMRKLIKPSHLIASPSLEQSATKENALRAYVSQTTRFEPEWARPVLDDTFIRRVVQGEELLLDSKSIRTDTAWMRHQAYAYCVNYLEPWLKRLKHRSAGAIRSIIGSKR